MIRWLLVCYCAVSPLRGVCEDEPRINMELVVAGAAAGLQEDGPPLRVEEFFWTGSGDGPAPPADPPPPPAPTTLLLTTTVLATLYLDTAQAPQPVTDATTGECILNCEPETLPASLQPAGVEPGVEPGTEPGAADRRYWLLTVVRGGTPDALQLRLARLYQKAFLRQQERHLGIVKSLDAPTSRKKHEVHSFAVNTNISRMEHPHVDHDIQSSMVVSPALRSRASDVTPNLNISSSFSISLSSIAPSHTQFTMNISESKTIAQIRATKLSEVEDMWILATSDDVVKREIADDEGDSLGDDYNDRSERMLEIPLEEETNGTSGVFKREIIKPEQQPPVHVYIQNVTESAESSVQIVYVVAVGGRAVPAAVAARDMRLVRDAEVAAELGFPVTTKAEPYLKAAEGLEGDAGAAVRGGEVWAVAGGALAAAILLILLLALLCRLVRRKKKLSSAALHSYRSELLRQAATSQLKLVHDEKDGRLISVVSPSRTRSTTSVPPRHTSSSSSTSSGVSEVAAALRGRQRRGQRAAHAHRSGLRLPHKRVGTTDSLLVSAGVSDSSSAGSTRAPSAPATPTSYLSMPSVKSFPRGNAVEPLTRVLEPVSVRHLDMDSPVHSPAPARKTSRPEASRRPAAALEAGPEVAPPPPPRRQMAAQLVRLGSMDKDPGVVGPLVWDLHCQRIKEMPHRTVTAVAAVTAEGRAGAVKEVGNISRMRQRFNELVDDAFSLFGSPSSSPTARARTGGGGGGGDALTAAADLSKAKEIAQARNDNVRLPGSPYSALDTLRGRSANVRPTTSSVSFSPQPMLEGDRPRTSLPKHPTIERRRPPARAWDTPSPQMVTAVAEPRVNPHLVLAEGRLPPTDPALPLISAIKSEIQRVRDANRPYQHN